MTPNYESIQKLIEDTLANKPIGHEITPEEHQALELSLLEYAKNLELIQVSTLIGFADANTTPVQPNGANAAYVNTIPNSTTIVFNNFRDVDGNPISVTTEDDYAALNILFWNAGNKDTRNGWSVYTTQIPITAIADLSSIIRKITLQEDLTTNVTCGGIESGTVLPAGTEIKEIIERMLFTYIAPSVTISGGGTYEVGTSINPSINYRATNSSSANVTKITLSKTSGGVTTEVDEKDPATSGTTYTFNDSDITEDTTYTANVYDDVAGEEADNRKETKIYFFPKFFWGYASIGSLPQTSVGVRSLNYNGFLDTRGSAVTIVGDVNTDSPAYYLVVAVPSGYRVVAQNTFGGDYVVVLNGFVDVNIGGGLSQDTLQYRVYYIGGTPSFKNLKIVRD